MDTRQELDRLLARLRSEGEHDSEGAFTLSLEAALRKLAEFRLPRGAYLLKFVQAAARWGGSRIEVRLGSREASILFETPWVVDRELLEQAATSPLGSSPHPALEHLLVGLMAARETCDEPVCWLWDDAVTAALRMDHQGLRVTYHSPLQGVFPAGALIQLRRRQRSLWEGVRGWFGTSDEHALLSRGARFAPLPVRLDGRWLNAPTLPGFWADLSQYALILVERDLILGSETGHHLLAVDQPRWRAARRVELQEQQYNLFAHQQMHCTSLLQLRVSRFRALRSGELEVYLGVRDGQSYSADLPLFPFESSTLVGTRSRPVAALASLALSDRLEGPGHLTLVKDGVMLPAREVDLGCPGVMALASAEGLQADLSQLDVVEDEAYQTLLSQLRNHVAEMLREVPGQVSMLLREGREYDYKKRVLDRLPRA